MSRTKEIISHLKMRNVIVGKKPGKPALKNTEKKRYSSKLIGTYKMYNIRIPLGDTKRKKKQIMQTFNII